MTIVDLRLRSRRCRPPSRRSSGVPRIPAGFRAGGAAAGIKASGRPDLAIVATSTGRRGGRGRGLHPERVRGRARSQLRQAHLAATDPAGDGALRLGRGDRLDERLRERRDGRRPATPTRPRSRAVLATALGIAPASRRSASRPG